VHNSQPTNSTFLDNHNFEQPINYEAPSHVFCKPPTSSVTRKDILLGSLLSHTLHILSFLKAKGKVSHPHNFFSHKKKSELCK
jgi:hypothetical protein